MDVLQTLVLDTLTHILTVNSSIKLVLTFAVMTPLELIDSLDPE